MGTEDLYHYIRKYKITVPAPVAKLIKSYPQQEFEEFVNKGN
jgi:hypothetical protein